MRVVDCILVRGTDKIYIECINEENYVTVLSIIARNTEIVPHDQCCQVTIVEGTGSRSGHMRNIYSAPNQHIMLIISSQITQSEEEESGRGEGWLEVVVEVGL